MAELQLLFYFYFYFTYFNLGNVTHIKSHTVKFNLFMCHLKMIKGDKHVVAENETLLENKSCVDRKILVIIIVYSTTGLLK
jgi:hypothetical protein